jgi:hypothetical protein
MPGVGSFESAMTGSPTPSDRGGQRGVVYGEMVDLLDARRDAALSLESQWDLSIRPQVSAPRSY